MNDLELVEVELKEEKILNFHQNLHNVPIITTINIFFLEG